MKLGTKMLLGIAGVGAAVVALDTYARNNPAKVENMKDTVRKNATKTKEKTIELTEDIKEKVEPVAQKTSAYLKNQTGKMKEKLLSYSLKNKEGDTDNKEDLELEILEDIVRFLEEKDLKDARMIVIKSVDSSEEQEDDDKE